MSDDDSQNVKVQDYDDRFTDPGPGTEFGDSTLTVSEVYMVRAREPQTPSARAVRPITVAPSSTVQPSEGPSTSADTTIGKPTLTAEKFLYLDPDSCRGIRVDLAIKEERAI